MRERVILMDDVVISGCFTNSMLFIGYIIANPLMRSVFHQSVQAQCLVIEAVFCRDGRFGSKVGMIGPKWDKSGAFSDQISVHLAQGRQMH